jgi:hypothetical protein
MKILVSPGFGAGWSTWVYDAEASRLALTWAPLIEFIEAGGDKNELTWDHPALAGLQDVYPDLYVSTNVLDLYVVDIPAGTSFRINEYDGSESIDYGQGFITAD